MISKYDLLSSDTSEAEFQLKKLFAENSSLFDSHQWPSEDLRWVELLTALLLASNKKHESKIAPIDTN
jgi:hypothetical protein